jgi:hypothetical protein
VVADTQTALRSAMLPRCLYIQIKYASQSHSAARKLGKIKGKEQIVHEVFLVYGDNLYKHAKVNVLFLAEIAPSKDVSILLDLSQLHHKYWPLTTIYIPILHYKYHEYHPSK